MSSPSVLSASGQTGSAMWCLASPFATRAVRFGSFLARSALRLPLFHGMHRFIGPLLLREGCKLIQVPVNHRPRASGRSHYNLWNRSLCVLIDLLGVVWLLRRPVRLSSDPEAAIRNRRSALLDQKTRFQPCTRFQEG